MEIACVAALNFKGRSMWKRDGVPVDIARSDEVQFRKSRCGNRGMRGGVGGEFPDGRCALVMVTPLPRFRTATIKVGDDEVPVQVAVFAIPIESGASVIPMESDKVVG